MFFDYLRGQSRTASAARDCPPAGLSNTVRGQGRVLFGPLYLADDVARAFRSPTKSSMAHGRETSGNIGAVTSSSVVEIGGQNMQSYRGSSGAAPGDGAPQRM